MEEIKKVQIKKLSLKVNPYSSEESINSKLEDTS